MNLLFQKKNKNKKRTTNDLKYYSFSIGGTGTMTGEFLWAIKACECS